MREKPDYTKLGFEPVYMRENAPAIGYRKNFQWQDSNGIPHQLALHCMMQGDTLEGLYFNAPNDKPDRDLAVQDFIRHIEGDVAVHPLSQHGQTDYLLTFKSAGVASYSDAENLVEALAWFVEDPSIALSQYLEKARTQPDKPIAHAARTEQYRIEQPTPSQQFEIFMLLRKHMPTREGEVTMATTALISGMVEGQRLTDLLQAQLPELDRAVRQDLAASIGTIITPPDKKRAL